MGRSGIGVVISLGVFAAAISNPSLGPEQLSRGDAGEASAESADTAEKEAFEAAKELGTVDAWNAFLANYATGFHADLARAYLKKLGGDAPPPDEFPVVAGSWGGIVRDGPGQHFRKVDSLEEGQQVTLMARTDVVENGFPWFKIAYENGGTGYQWGGILCSASAERADLFKTCPPTARQEKTGAPAKRPKSCAKGHMLIDGKCIEAGAAAGYCGPGYRPEAGKCVRGYQPPDRDTPLSAEQKKAVSKGCPKGQVWNAAEGCHEDD